MKAVTLRIAARWAVPHPEMLHPESLEELCIRVGDAVHYSIRFEDSTSLIAVIKCMTDGMILRALMTKPHMIWSVFSTSWQNLPT
ncbi:hypothetical protein O181_116685 [Austropuccinia psidii MF-1]|uniref:Uncharacterized protein n=1 Tax=Austropuccinia psidii MF-1 TaxID=1389203 RepID=A0A9Q3KCX8_9BASI|nr:hypothetical protein [Austropuccinia psidii MF-1]